MMEEDNGPRGNLHKIVAVRLQTMHGNYTETVGETLEMVLKLLLSDKDTVGQIELRKPMLLDSQGHDIVLFLHQKIKKSLQEMINKNATGYDGIKADTLRRMFG